MKNITEIVILNRLKYLAKTQGFYKFTVTTNVNKIANAVSEFFTHYIYAAGGQLFWQRHSWLSVAFPGIFYSLTSKRQPQ